MANSPELPVPSGSKALGLFGICVVVDSSSWGSGSSGSPVFSVGSREVVSFSSATSSMEILDRPSILMRYVRHWWRSWMAPQSLLRGASACMEHLWRAWSSATVSFCLTSLMSWQLWNGRGRKSPSFNPAIQGRAFHQLLLSCWALGSQKAMTCLLARSCTPLFTEDLSTHVVKEPEFLPPIWYSPILLDVCPDLHDGATWEGSWWALGFSPLLRSLGFLRWVTMGNQSHGWRSRGTQGIKLLSWFLRLGSFQTFMGGCSSLLSHLWLQFSPRRVTSSSGVGEVLHLSSVGWRSEVSTISSLYIKGVRHLWSSHTALQRTPVGAPSLSALHCRAQSRAMVFPCLMVQNSLILGELTWGRMSWGCSSVRQGGASHQCDVLCWARGSLKAAACHQESSKASVYWEQTLHGIGRGFYSPSINKDDLLSCPTVPKSRHWDDPLGQASLLSWDLDWHWAAAEGLTVAFGQAPHGCVGWCWWPLAWGGCGGSTVKGTEGLGASSQSLAVPTSRKVVRSMSSEGSSPKSSSLLNLTCFFTSCLGGHSSIGSAEEGDIFQCCQRCQHSVSCFGIPVAKGAGEDHPGTNWATCQQDEIMEGLEMGRSTCWVCGGRFQHLDVWERDSSVIAAVSYTWDGNITFLILITWLKGLPLDIWPPPFPRAQLKETELMRKEAVGAFPTLWSGTIWPWFTLEVSSSHGLGQFNS